MKDYSSYPLHEVALERTAEAFVNEVAWDREKSVRAITGLIKNLGHHSRDQQISFMAQIIAVLTAEMDNL